MVRTSYLGSWNGHWTNINKKSVQYGRYLRISPCNMFMWIIWINKSSNEIVNCPSEKLRCGILLPYTRVIGVICTNFAIINGAPIRLYIMQWGSYCFSGLLRDHRSVQGDTAGSWSSDFCSVYIPDWQGLHGKFTLEMSVPTNSNHACLTKLSQVKKADSDLLTKTRYCVWPKQDWRHVNLTTWWLKPLTE